MKNYFNNQEHTNDLLNVISNDGKSCEEIVVIIKLHKHAKKLKERLKKSQGDQEVIEDAFNEIIKNDPIYNEALKIIRSYYFESMSKKINELKTINKQLLNQIQQININNQQLIHDIKINYSTENTKLLNELTNLHNQNKVLKQNVFDLQKEIRYAKMQEITLENLLDKGIDKNYKQERMAKKKIKRDIGEVEVGKNKVKVPKLDLSIIEDTLDQPNPCYNLLDHT